MDLRDWKLTSFKHRVQLLREKGNYLATRTLENYYIKLYTIKGIYFEVWSSSHMPWENIVKVTVFKDLTQLRPYLPEIYFAENRPSF